MLKTGWNCCAQKTAIWHPHCGWSGVLYPTSQCLCWCCSVSSSLGWGVKIYPQQCCGFYWNKATKRYANQYSFNSDSVENLRTRPTENTWSSRQTNTRFSYWPVNVGWCCSSFHLPLSPERCLIVRAETDKAGPCVPRLPCFCWGWDSPRLQDSVPAVPLLPHSPCCSLAILYPRWDKPTQQPRGANHGGAAGNQPCLSCCYVTCLYGTLELVSLLLLCLPQNYNCSPPNLCIKTK